MAAMNAAMADIGSASNRIAKAAEKAGGDLGPTIRQTEKTLKDISAAAVSLEKQVGTLSRDFGSAANSTEEQLTAAVIELQADGRLDEPGARPAAGSPRRVARRHAEAKRTRRMNPATPPFGPDPRLRRVAARRLHQRRRRQQRRRRAGTVSPRRLRAAAGSRGQDRSAVPGRRPPCLRSASATRSRWRTRGHRSSAPLYQYAVVGGSPLEPRRAAARAAHRFARAPSLRWPNLAAASAATSR